MKKKYDVLIIGAGPAGIFVALELAKKSNLKVAILEKGFDIEVRIKRMSGWGGAGAYSDGKLTLSTEVGGQLLSNLPSDEADELLQYTDNIYLQFGANNTVYGVDDEKARAIHRKAVLANLKFIPMKVRHLGTDKCFFILKEMRKFLDDKVDIITETSVDQILVEDGKTSGIITKSGEKIFATYVVACPGREGSDWLSHEARRLGLGQKINPVDLGVRVEVPSAIAEPITKDVYESKLIFYSKLFDDRVRTFCMCPDGEVVTENYEGVITVNGHSYSDKKTDNTNFALLVSKNFTEPFKEPISYGQYIARLANLLGDGVMVQRLGDMLSGRRTNKSRLDKCLVVPTLKSATPGDLSLVLPYRYLTAILEMLQALDKLAPGIYSHHTLIYGVEVKFYSSSLDLSPGLETRIKNLFAAGDGAGVTRGLMQASVSGIVVARDILKKEHVESEE
jgi:hypothetical protein